MLTPWFGTAMYEQGSAMGRLVRQIVVTIYIWYLSKKPCNIQVLISVQ